MSDFLFGSMQSGSPPETVEGTKDISQMLQSLLSSSGAADSSNPFGQLISQAMQNLTGMSPGNIGLEGAAARFFGDPTERIQQGAGDMWASRQDKWRSGKADILEGMSGFGGATGTSATGNLGRAYGESLNQHNVDVGNLINQAFGQQGAALAPIMQAFTQAGLGNQGQMFDFLAPGPAAYQPGAIGEILKLGTAIAGMATGNPAAAGAMGDMSGRINALGNQQFNTDLFKDQQLGRFRRGR